jgi:hypothetical protein
LSRKSRAQRIEQAVQDRGRRRKVAPAVWSLRWTTDHQPIEPVGVGRVARSTALPVPVAARAVDLVAAAVTALVSIAKGSSVADGPS